MENLVDELSSIKKKCEEIKEMISKLSVTKEIHEKEAEEIEKELKTMGFNPSEVSRILPEKLKDLKKKVDLLSESITKFSEELVKKEETFLKEYKDKYSKLL